LVGVATYQRQAYNLICSDAFRQHCKVLASKKEHCKVLIEGGVKLTVRTCEDRKRKGQSSEVLSNNCGMELKPSATMTISGMEVAGATRSHGQWVED
jgi:hypothetical protein